MSIRDIIEAADPHGWYSANAFASPADGCFIAAFDPEHVALMEAVCEAAKAVAADYEKQPDDCDAVELTAMYQRLASATSALQAYRKTHGYGD